MVDIPTALCPLDRLLDFCSASAFPFYAIYGRVHKSRQRGREVERERQTEQESEGEFLVEIILKYCRQKLPVWKTNDWVCECINMNEKLFELCVCARERYMRVRER